MSSATSGTIPAPRNELWTLGVVGAVHWVSHFYWLVFVPLLPMLKDLLQVSYIELGLAITVMNVVSALVQAPTGFLVARFGPRLFLMLGVAAGAAGYILVGLFPTYPMLIVAAVLVGAGNAVYHPADYAILSAEMSKERMGRAYSFHTFSGYLGFAAVPPVVLAMAYWGGPQFALVGSGLLGVIVALPLLPDIPREQRETRIRAAAPQIKGPSARSLMTPAVIALTIMFTTLNLATGVMQTYMVVALSDMLGFAHSIGNTALTTFMVTSVAGVLLGGWLADKAAKQSTVAAAGFGLAAVFIFLIAVLKPSAPVVIGLIAMAGFVAGMVMPSRDLLVREASPPQSVAPVFGIVTTGFNFGSIVGAPLGGAILDHGLPAWIFYFSAIFMLVTVAIALWVDRQPPPSPIKSN